MLINRNYAAAAKDHSCNAVFPSREQRRGHHMCTALEEKELDQD